MTAVSFVSQAVNGGRFATMGTGRAAAAAGMLLPAAITFTSLYSPASWLGRKSASASILSPLFA